MTTLAYAHSGLCKFVQVLPVPGESQKWQGECLDCGMVGPVRASMFSASEAFGAAEDRGTLLFPGDEGADDD